MKARPEEQAFRPQSPEIAKRVQTLKPYEAVSSRVKIERNPSIRHHKLDWNESTIQPSPKVHEALVNFVSQGGALNWYPDLFHLPLYERLAEYTGSRISRLIVTNGSDAALELLCQSYLDPEDNVVFPEPTYNHFVQFAELTGAELRGVKCRNVFQPTLAELEQHIDERTKILYLVNPNNPTGNVYLPAEVLDLAVRYPHVLVISDEAYFEFSGVSCVKLVDEVPNLVVTRSFSKAFSLASLRIGYLVAQECVIENLRRMYNPKSVNMLAQVAAAAALEDLSYYRAYVREVKRSAALVEAFCRRHGVRCRVTYANWILLEFKDAKAMAQRLAEAGIHVRDRSSQLPGVLRMSLGTEAQTVDVLARLERILEADQAAPRARYLGIAPDVR
ncbi:MAG TPA: histidinol-phosphate transaminase [Myxococcota bacterium]|nr:histidinol-phosphate transaminase [Myxococcota bacterium]HRY94006.1 histidinol-phosphate transaminase [Myxococcota bacterium]